MSIHETKGGLGCIGYMSNNDKTDIRQHSDAELSLWVMNDECLYKEVKRFSATERSITELVSELFIFTPDQLADLIETVNDDRLEDGDDALD